MAEKNPIVAALLSIIPGWGQWYNEKSYVKSLIFLIIIHGLNFFGITLIAILVWLIGLIEAYMTATKINRNEVPFVAVSIGQLILYLVVAFVTVVFMSILYSLFFSAGMYTQ